MRFADPAVDPLPDDSDRAMLVGRVWNPAAGGPSVVVVRGGRVVDISARAATMRDLCESDDPSGTAASAEGDAIGPLTEVLANTPRPDRDASRPWLLSPIDLQAVKAAGVTFVVSMLERVIEEQARGSAERANAIRA